MYRDRSCGMPFLCRFPVGIRPACSWRVPCGPSALKHEPGVVVNSYIAIKAGIPGRDRLSLFSVRAVRQVLLCQTMQRNTIDLVGRGQRQLVHEPHEAWMRVGRRIGERELLDPVL